MARRRFQAGHEQNPAELAGLFSQSPQGPRNHSMVFGESGLSSITYPRVTEGGEIFTSFFRGRSLVEANSRLMKSRVGVRGEVLNV